MDQATVAPLIVLALLWSKAPPQGPHSCSEIKEGSPSVRDIRFGRNSFTLNKDDMRMLDQFATFMRDKKCIVRIEGFSDKAEELGDKNRASQKRADALKAY